MKIGSDTMVFKKGSNFVFPKGKGLSIFSCVVGVEENGLCVEFFH